MSDPKPPAREAAERRRLFDDVCAEKILGFLGIDHEPGGYTVECVADLVTDRVNTAISEAEPAEKAARDAMCECGTAHYCEREFVAARREGAREMRERCLRVVDTQGYIYTAEEAGKRCALAEAIRDLPLIPYGDEPKEVLAECDACRGTGFLDALGISCDVCVGSGEVRRLDCDEGEES